MNLKFKKLDEAAVAPSYATEGDAGMDLRALEAHTLKPGEHKLFKTGIAFELPANTVGYVCSRSGLAAKHGVFVLNAPGVIDSGYRGDVGVVLKNLGNEDFEVQAGDRIAQFVIQEFISVKPVEVEELGVSSRGAGGFGSTGVRDAAAVVVVEELDEEELSVDPEAVEAVAVVAEVEETEFASLPALGSDESEEDEFSSAR